MARRAFARTGTLAFAALALLTTLASDTRVVRRLRHALEPHWRDARHRADGLRYRLRGRRPDPNVSDDVLADRVRSALGSLERRLDIPRVHVLVDHHVVWLHGTVNRGADVEAIERAVMRVSGVDAVGSHLHVGLARGDTRPSEGRAAVQHSDAYRRMVAATRGAGVPRHWEPVAIGSVLSTLAARVPHGEFVHLAAHLPPDVRALCDPRPVRPARPLRTDDDFIAAVVARGGVPERHGRRTVEAALRELRRLVPEEANDIAAVLPHDVRAMWEGASRDDTRRSS